MKWEDRRRSSNVEDRRSQGSRMPGRGGLTVGGLVLILIVTLLRGGGIGDVLGSVIMSEVASGGTQTEEYIETPEHKKLAEFSKVVLADTEAVWTELFKQYGETYNPPTMVLYSGSVESGCGFASSQVGPFYCPMDKKLYIDLSFYDDLNKKYGASGDFAFAYVIAHEVGHHVQNELGIMEQVQPLRQQLSEKEYNKYSVALELQADYLAGVFAAYEQGQGYLEKGDIEEALQAANAVGDDVLQKRAQGHVVPDSFTHGTGEQRMEWFMKGFKAGDLSEWDTFKYIK
ncbi:MAG: neutral zinc metallopeptidase [Tissierellia bacterium]|nr:neutral zinc metallopeptidase [Tissierellia bacterium]